jgi:hypothetical protein
MEHRDDELTPAIMTLGAVLGSCLLGAILSLL